MRSDKFYIRDAERIEKIRMQIEAGTLRRDQVNERDMALLERIEEAEAEEMKEDGAALKIKMRKLKRGFKNAMENVKQTFVDMKEAQDIKNGKIPPKPVEEKEEEEYVDDPNTEEDDIIH